MFMAQTFDSGKDLSREMHVLRAIRWGISAWENDVTPSTIQNCWARSQAIDFGARPFLPDFWTESQSQVDAIRQALYRLKQSGYITEVLNVHEYISPYTEQVNDNCPPDSLVDEIVALYTEEEEEEEEEEEGQGVALLRVSCQEALLALNTLRQYEEQNSGDLGLLRLLRSRERELVNTQLSSKSQTQLNSWLVRST
jgi:hypothetical protein